MTLPKSGGPFKLTAHFYKNDQSTAVLELTGLEAWALNELAKAGLKGCTPINQPAPRWSAYIYLLRKRSIHIETVTEPHGGTFAGTHARYVLRDKVEIVEISHAGGK